MITVNCSQCKAPLEMDDAFAGGVCRCHYCGTIQAVPAHAKRQGVPAATAPAPQAPAPARTARGNGAATQGLPTRGDDGLNALADVVASSGVSRAGAQSAPVAAPPPPTVDYARPPAKPLMMPLLIALGVIAVLMLVLVFMLMSARSVTTNTAATVSPPVATPSAAPAVKPGNPATPQQPPPPGGESVGEVPVPKGPQFCGISLDAVPSVVYVLDRGEATAELFDTLKEATYRSLESLKPGQKFQIIFWDNADAPASYPAQGLAPVSPQEIDAARAQFADVIAGGRAKADGAVDRAAASHPAAIVIVTGKAFDLENGLADKVQAAVHGSGTKVHTVALRSDDGNAVLKTIAAANHGEFRVVTAKELREFSY